MFPLLCELLAEVAGYWLGSQDGWSISRWLPHMSWVHLQWSQEKDLEVTRLCTCCSQLLALTELILGLRCRFCCGTVSLWGGNVFWEIQSAMLRIVAVTVWVPVRINEVILIGSGLLVRIQSLWFSF